MTVPPRGFLDSTSLGLTVMVAALTNGDVLRIPEIGIELPVAGFCEELEFTGTVTVNVGWY